MPYIDINITNKLKDREKDIIKSKLGELITIIPGKNETGLMIGINDGYTIYFGGDKKDKSAYITIQMYKSSEFEYEAEFTQKVFEFFEEELGISKNNLYLNFGEHEYWGSNGVLKR